MVQAADRRQLGATSTPPSLPAPSWRRDLSEQTVKRLPAGTIVAEGRVCVRPPDRPALVMLLAPFLGLAMWIGLAALLF